MTSRTTPARTASSRASGEEAAAADGDEPPLTFRHPEIQSGDGFRMWRLASESEGLETNSEYTYHLFAEFFPETCLVAEVGGEPAGFIVGFRPPKAPDTLFVWQIGVDPAYRGRGIAKQMLSELTARAHDDGVRYLEASVTPSNTASQRTFHSYQQQQRTQCEESPLFPADLFGSADHEMEMRYRIGPIDRRESPECTEALWDEPTDAPTDEAHAQRSHRMTTTATNPLQTFETLESEVRSYIRSWPTVFTEAEGSTLRDEEGREFIDFFAGAGALNYGHNDPAMKERLLEYIGRNGIVHSLDTATTAKRDFLETFEEIILKPRSLDYVVQFPGPTGTNAVEAALKLARKVKGRELVVGFTNAFHGMTLGSLSVTGNSMKRGGGGVPLNNAVAMPYDGFFGSDVDSLDYFETFLSEDGSGVDGPAAVIVETLQGEGGIHVASYEFLARLQELCRAHDMLLIVDDVQMGCGRTGPFFSFEPAGIEPDIVCLSKSLSGYGVPFAVTLFRRELDQWEPGEHNGTFRGHNLAFVTATEALRRWRTDEITRGVKTRAAEMKLRLHEIAHRYPEAEPAWRGRGLAQGLHLPVDGLADAVCREAFDRGLIMETSGANSDVIKLMPPLTIEEELLDQGLTIVDQSLAAALREPPFNSGSEAAVVAAPSRNGSGS